MPKSTGLSLSKYQQDIVSLLEIDAWYLKPLSRRGSVTEKESQALEQTFKALSDRLAAPSVRPKDRAEQNSTQTLSDSSVPSSSDSRSAVTDTNKQARLSDSPPKPIKLARTVDTNLPESPQVIMPYGKNYLLDWSALTKALEALPHQPQLPVFNGIGKKTAQWLFILPPPGRRAVKEKQLLDQASLTLFKGVLTAVNQTLEQVYFTPLTKQGNLYGLEPDSDTLAEQIPLLASEILLVKPEKVFVLGQVAASQLLQTQVLLGELMNQTYQLELGDEDCGSHQAELICLPDFDYYLALPGEKAELWQALKGLN